LATLIIDGRCAVRVAGQVGGAERHVRPWDFANRSGGRKTLNVRILALLVGATLALLVPQAPAHAQARSWVSGTGNDSNPCTRALPCKTFAGALAKTAAGGEIFALDGGEYDGLLIDRAITIDGGSQNASVHSTSSDAITVSVNPGDVVIIRNLHVRGLGTPLATGIVFDLGALLSIENCTISGASTAGIAAQTAPGGASATLNVFNTTITDAGVGISLRPLSGSIFGQADHLTIQREAAASGSGGTGIQAIGPVVFTVTNSNILNAQVAGIAAAAGAVVNVDSSSVSSNNTAFVANGGIIRVSRSSIYDNINNFSITSGGVTATSGDNVGAINGATMPNGTVSKF
jgi:hypothetical protein